MMLVWFILTLLIPVTINFVQSAPAPFLLAPAPAPALPAYKIAKPNCSSTCGSLVVPYPFGITRDCCLEDEYDTYLITCNGTTPYLAESTIKIHNISLNGHHVHVLTSAARICYNESGYVTYRTLNYLRLSKFQVNSDHNKFNVIGCSTLALITGSRVRNYTTGCASLCKDVERVENGSCSGIGCCQTSLPIGARDFEVTFMLLDNSVLPNIPCSSAFVVQEGVYNFSSSDLYALDATSFRYPVMLDWAVGNESCQVAKKNKTSYACVAADSNCTNSVYGEGTGYQCSCASGYEGNPYLSNGCIGMCCTCSYPKVCSVAVYINIQKRYVFFCNELSMVLKKIGLLFQY